jgi:hypothetical protein
MMDTEKKQRHKIYSIGWNIILAVCAILALILAAKNNVNEYCSINEMMNYMGVIVTTVGLVVTGFFVILAIDMFSIYRDIRSNKETLKKDTIAFQKRQKEYDKILEDYAQSLYDGFDAQIGLASSSGTTNNTSLIQQLRLKKARLSYKYPMLAVHNRIIMLAELGHIGEIQDVIPIQNLIDNENEQEEIKKVAQKILEELKKKFVIC